MHNTIQYTITWYNTQLSLIIIIIIINTLLLARSYRETFSAAIPLELLLDDLSTTIHTTTIQAGARPLGIQLIACRYDVEEHSYQIYSVDPEGSYKAWRAVCIGGGSGGGVLEGKLMTALEGEESVKECGDRNMSEVLPELIKAIERVANSGPHHHHHQSSSSSTSSSTDSEVGEEGDQSGEQRWMMEVNIYMSNR